jgi:Ca-activated chloride channel homolog
METSPLTFSQPVWFFALAIVPIVAALYVWSQRRSDALLSKVVAPRLRSQLAGTVSKGRRTLKSAVILVVFGLIAVALARPQMGFVQREVKQRGRDVIIVIDTSRSMLATDVAPSRLSRAKLVAQDLLRLVRGDRVGLVAFAGSAFLQAPLTLDYNAVLTSLEELDTTVIPKGGSNIAEAIRIAEQAFGKGEGQTRALVILTDGEELDADGVAAAKRAGELGVRVFTVGIGSAEGSLIPLRTDESGNDFVRDSAGKPVQSKLDEKRLKQIAEVGGGFYEPLGAEAARKIFENGILKLEQAETGILSARQPIERYQWPLSVAVGLLALWLLLGDRRRPIVLRKSATALFLLGLSVSLSTAATGLDEYEAGNFEKAKADFERRLQAAPQSDKLHFNAGAASYKIGDFASAVDHFTQSLLSGDPKLREDSSYNLGNALVRRGEAAKGNEEKKADWKNAIQHYSEALKLDPQNKQADENREIVKKMLDDLEKQQKEQQQQKQDQQQQKQDQQQQKQDQQQQKQDQQQQKQDQQQQKQDQQQQKQDQQQQKQDQQQQKQDQQQQKQDQQQQKQDQQQQKQDQQQQKQDQQQQKQDQQQQNQGQAKQDQQQKQQTGDQQQQKQASKDQEPAKPAQNEKGQQSQDQPEKDRDGKDQPENKSQPQRQQEMAKNRDQPPGQQPQPTPGEKKKGDLKPGEGQQPEPEPEGTSGEAVEKDGEMSPAQARGLLNSLRSEEDRVRLMQRKELEDTLKDW